MKYKKSYNYSCHSWYNYPKSENGAGNTYADTVASSKTHCFHLVTNKKLLSLQ